MALTPGARLGPYEILVAIGAGGMGEVYRAKDAKLNREVAIKVLPESLARDTHALARFEREARAVAALNHPNILSILGFGTDEGTVYAIMELLEGSTLREKLAAGPLHQQQAVDVALQIARGLAAAHEKAIVHRDLKPENIFLMRDGHVKILDFGLARMSGVSEFGAASGAPGAGRGTVGYMSPEQVRGQPVDHRSDIFSFGAVLYEMLLGRRAFGAEGITDTLAAILNEEPPDLATRAPSISPALVRIVRHSMEKEPADRFQSAEEIVAELEWENYPPVAASAAPPQSTSPSRIAGWFGKVFRTTKSFKTEGGDREEEEGSLYPVFFGTNRKLINTGDPNQGFSTDRSDSVTYGRCQVWIPEAHRFGEVGTQWWRRWARFQFADDHLSLKQTDVFSDTEFWQTLSREMLKADDDAPDGLVYLHGFNVGFEEAAIRAAQMGVDLKVSGATGFFSWPSQHAVKDYVADSAAIEASEEAISTFLADFVGKSGARSVHVVAHSMGNRGLLRALQRLSAKAKAAGGVRFAQIFLAAPDVDRDVFLGLAHVYREFSRRTTLYSSHRDKAVAASAWVHKSPRAGYFPPITMVDGLDTVVVPNFNVDLLGHAYFAKAAALLNDMYDLMRNGTPPDKRQRLTKKRGYWRMRR